MSLTEDDVAKLNDQACTNNLGRQGEWEELNEDGKAWARELARLAYERGRVDARATAGYPLKPIEVTITANGFNWEQAIAALDERVERLTKHQENGAGCSASGYSASHTADVRLRDVTVDQFVEESIAWLEQQKPEGPKGDA
jgi:hypothetical protein